MDLLNNIITSESEYYNNVFFNTFNQSHLHEEALAESLGRVHGAKAGRVLGATEWTLNLINNQNIDLLTVGLKLSIKAKAKQQETLLTLAKQRDNSIIPSELLVSSTDSDHSWTTYISKVLEHGMSIRHLVLLHPELGVPLHPVLKSLNQSADLEW